MQHYPKELREGPCAGTRLQLPDVAALAFIPFSFDIHDRTSPIYNTAYRKHKYENAARLGRWFLRGRAFTRLFATGNATAPPQSFSDRDEFRAFLIPENYRAAMCLFGVTLYYDDGTGTARGLACWWENRIGYTPVRLRAVDLTSSNPTVLAREPGSGKSGPSANFSPTITPGPDPNGYTIRNRCMFKIGRPGDLYNWWITGHRAPFCYVEIEYRVRVDDRARLVHVEILFSGTAIPSQTYYVGWLHAEAHTMLQATEEEITEFVGGETCKEAQGRYRDGRWRATLALG